MTSARPARPRLALAVEPPVLRDALAQVLGSTGVDEVVDLTSTETLPGEHFDVVLVTGASSRPDADIVITLPTETSPGWADVGGVRRALDGSSVAHLLGALDRWCPGDRRRAVPRRPPGRAG